MGDVDVASAATQFAIDKFPVSVDKVKKPKIKKIVRKVVIKKVRKKVKNSSLINNNDDELEEGELGTLPIDYVSNVTKDELETAVPDQHSTKMSKYSPPAKETGWNTELNDKSSYNIAGYEGFSRNDVTNGNSHYSLDNRFKWNDNADSYGRNYRIDYDEYTMSKYRKLSDDGSHYSSRPYKKAAPFSSRNISAERYSSRFSDSPVNDRRISSPHQSQRSPNDQSLSYDRAKSRDRSPYDWAYVKERSGSPYDRKGRYDNRYQSPSYGPRSSSVSPLDQGRSETNRKSGVVERRSTNLRRKELKNGELQNLPKKSKCKDNLNNKNYLTDKTTNSLPHNENMDNNHSKDADSSLENGVTEEPTSMEEDMDICYTPPHLPLVVDAVVSGKWYYLDEFGNECGPAKLSDLKTLAEEGYLASDHFIKHLDSVRWVCVENAVSPLMAANFPSVVPDLVTQRACPPEASGNLLEDSGKGILGNMTDDDLAISSLTNVDSANVLYASEPVEGLHIDERVGALLEGVTLIPGKEPNMILEMLGRTTEHGDWKTWRNVEGYVWHQLQMIDHHDDNAARYLSNVSEYALKDNELCSRDTIEWFSDQWALKGGDWKRNNESTLDNRTWNRKLILNDGYPLCQMPKSGCEDPRSLRRDELYFASQSRKLELPSWAFTSLDELNNPMKSSKTKSLIVRGITGTMLPVIRINTCVVTDSGSFISEPRAEVRGKQIYSTMASHSYSTTGNMKRSLEDSHSNSSYEVEDSWKIPKDRLCKVDELQLQLGDWYYLDGAGHDLGPSSFSELQGMADTGAVQKHISVFRKQDKLWAPLNILPDLSGRTAKHEDGIASFPSSSEANIVGGLHDLHPQFIGYTRGKLHELVMKSYKSREFAAAINVVLDPWINARQPKKDMEKYDHLRSSKRARTEDVYVVEEDESTLQKDDSSFDDLCADVTFGNNEESVSEVESNIWHLLDGHVLARIFHFLRADMKSLLHAALTCKQWRSAAKFYMNISRHVDFCSFAANCSNSIIMKIMNNYNKEKITSLILRGCTGVTSGFLEDIIRSFAFLSTIDIRGCSQLEDLVCKFPHITWIRNIPLQLKIRSLNHFTDNGSCQIEYSSGLKEYLESSDKRDAANQLFCRSLYKRSKLFDARKSSSISSRDAQLRRLAMKKYGNGYKRMEEFIAASIREIMKQNSFDFFGHKIAEIEQRMKSGYYASHGLNSVKEDISRMCRDAIIVKDCRDTKDWTRIVKLFIQLVTSLERCSKLAYGNGEIRKSWSDHSSRGLSSSSSSSSSSSMHIKNSNKLSERIHSYRSNGSSFVNGFIDSEDFTSDREIRRRLSKLSRKAFDSGSDISDDFDKSSLGSATSSESSGSDTESDLEFQSEGTNDDSKRETCFTPDYEFDSLADEREWGARMTKASLVPPVTRKYEVIDHYIIIADEEEVKRKLRVSLPDNYDEKLNMERTGDEESDMEIPEVKDYKPRKSLGDEVIEQEVYGIDPYTHNLLLDSMPDELDCSHFDKHLFIEDILLSSLNKKVRNFTGSGNAPMVYPLKPVFDDIFEIAKESCDERMMRLCLYMLKTIDNRPRDNYVAYRKGLGVVCNKEDGFSKDDFVVEVLGEVYPTWKWYEKQDGIRAFQKNKDEAAPEFYNIYLERPKGDADGYDLVVIDAMHKANYASRICHSCKPNCEAKVTAVDGHYQIGIYSLRPIAYGEEITFDYNSVTESKEEYEASVCLCGNQVCRGSYLNLTGEGFFQKVLKEYHGLLDRHRLLLEACELNSVNEEDYVDLGKAGLGSCLLGGLPDWLIAYSARLVRFINFERTKLPSEILKHNIEEKKKYFAEINLDVEKSDAEIQAEGVYNNRLQNLALTIDKVRYVMRCVFGDPKSAPPPLERLSPEAAVSYLWKGEGSFVEELLKCMSPHMEDVMLRHLKAKIHANDPSGSEDIELGLRKSLLWLRDEVRNLPCTYKSRHDAAADLIHIHAYTKSFIRLKEYKTVTSPPVHITPPDLGPKYADKLGSGVHEYCKTYGETYCLGQLMFWHSQNSEPDAILDKESRGCLSLPDIGSFYAKVQKPSRQRVYGPKTVKCMLSRMEKQPQRPWPRDRIWMFKTSLRIVGSPTLDVVLHDTSSVDKEMVHWLKHRPSLFQASWDI